MKIDPHDADFDVRSWVLPFAPATLVAVALAIWEPDAPGPAHADAAAAPVGYEAIEDCDVPDAGLEFDPMPPAAMAGGG